MIKTQMHQTVVIAVHNKLLFIVFIIHDTFSFGKINGNNND